MTGILLQLLGDGILTDSLGRTVDFRNTIIILTSNVGAHILQKNPSMGFSAGADAEGDYELLKSRVMEEMKKSFRPEFLNRINDIVLFRSLTKDNMRAIVSLELDKLRARLAERGLSMAVSAEAEDFLISKGWDEKYGARPLKRAIERELEDNIAEEILRGSIGGRRRGNKGRSWQAAAGASNFPRKREDRRSVAGARHKDAKQRRGYSLLKRTRAVRFFFCALREGRAGRGADRRGAAARQAKLQTLLRPLF